MRLISATITLAALLAAPALTADEGQLTDVERQEVLDLLEESRAMFLGLIDGLSEEQWNFKPKPDRWSVGQCAEHIVRSERSLFASSKRALEGTPDPDWKTKTDGKAAFLKQVMPNRNPGGAGGASAPQEVRPVDDLTREQVLAEFEQHRREVHQFLDTLDKPLKQYIEEHPFPIFNSLNSYDWLIYVPLHTIRHSKQIIEVQEADGYPKR